MTVQRLDGGCTLNKREKTSHRTPRSKVGLVDARKRRIRKQLKQRAEKSSAQSPFRGIFMLSIVIFKTPSPDLKAQLNDTDDSARYFEL